MKQISILFILFFNLLTFGQKIQKLTYFYFENQQISKQHFEELDSRKIFIKEIENDTSIIKNIHLHKNLAKLDSVQHSQINTFLKKIIGNDFKVNKKTMIHLYRKKDDKIYEDSKFKKYWRWIKNNSQRYQAFLIGSKDSQIEEDNEQHIYLDNYNLLESLFFKSSAFEINHLLIKPDGEIYIYYGLTNILDVLDWSVD
jgi:hypothetical protein